MLVLSRKTGESLMVGEDVVVANDDDGFFEEWGEFTSPRRAWFEGSEFHTTALHLLFGLALRVEV